MKKRKSDGRGNSGRTRVGITNVWLAAADECKMPKMLKPVEKEFWRRPPGSDVNPGGPHEAIDRAEGYRDYRLLAKHVRDGTACKEELSVIADILEDKIPSRRRGRPGRYDTFTHYMEVDKLVRDLMDAGRPVESAVAQAQKDFGFSRKQIYEIRRMVKEYEEYWVKLAREE